MKSERAARTLGWSSASDSSLRVRLSNGKTLTFDGFWEREACIELLHACARFVGHTIHVDESKRIRRGSKVLMPGIDPRKEDQTPWFG